MLARKLVIAVGLILLLTAGAAHAEGDSAAGAILAVDCADCHGEDGKGDDDIPTLAGLEDAYFIEQMQAFKSGERVDEDEMMPMYAEDLSDQDMADLAAYYATLPAE
jgi:cytochrome c553